MMTQCEQCLTHKELKVLYDIASLISDSRDIQKSLEKCLLALKNSLHLDNCVIYKLEDEVLNVFASLGFSKFQKVNSEYKLGEGATGLAAKSMGACSYRKCS